MAKATAGADAPAVAEVMALAECIIDGTRRQPGERFWVAADRVGALVQFGQVMPDAWINRMAPHARAQWNSIPPRTNGLADGTLVLDDAGRELLWRAGGRILSPSRIPSHYTPADPGVKPLRVLQITEYDPGSSVYRYHSAANTVPGILSAFVRSGHSNPHCDLRQWDAEDDRRTVEALAMTADVVHCHMDYRGAFQALRIGIEPHQRAAITYHGSVLPGDVGRKLIDEETDRRMNSVRFGARPYHHRFGIETWLPIPMPVQDYAALGSKYMPDHNAHTFRVAHSPTKRAIKGTAEFLDACAFVTKQTGVIVEPVLIEDMEHGMALKKKATCHAVFDSFWLGMQGSGLEGAAMGMPVLAGDPEAQEDMRRIGEDVPWTIANDFGGLVDALTRMVFDSAYYVAEAQRVHDYCVRVHDYPIVGAKYRETLYRELGRGAADSH